MAGTDKIYQSPIAIQELGVADLEGAQALVVESGWNQVRADWELFTRLGSAVKVEGPEMEVVATAATLPLVGFGWISMVLVAKAQRRQGIATALLQHCIDRLRASGLIPVLDATPAGREVYKLLGFRDGWAITRWRAIERKQASATRHDDKSVIVRQIRETDWPRIRELDLRAFGADRIALLRNLHSRSLSFSCVAELDGQLLGFLLGREGRLATQVGPIVAPDEGVAQLLVDHALAAIKGPVLVDVLDRHAELSHRMPAAGFAIERGYTRMTLGADTCFGDDTLMIAIAGPELG